MHHAIYIPIYEFKGQYSGNVTAQIERPQKENNNKSELEEKNKNTDTNIKQYDYIHKSISKQIHEIKIGTNLPSILNLNPGELGSFWDFLDILLRRLYDNQHIVQITNQKTYIYFIKYFKKLNNLWWTPLKNYLLERRFDRFISFCEDQMFNDNKLKNIQEKFLIGKSKPPFSVSQDEAELQVRKKTGKKIKAHVSGSLALIKNRVDYDSDVDIKELNVIKYYYPFWLAIYSYNNRKYLFMSDDQNRKRSEGIKPIDYYRILKIASFFKYFVLSSILFISLKIWYNKILDQIHEIKPILYIIILIFFTKAVYNTVILIKESYKIRIKRLNEIINA